MNAPSLLQYLYENAPAFKGTADFRSFYESMAMEELGRLDQLWSAVWAAEENNLPHAAAQAEALVRGMPDADDENGALAVRTFAEAMLERLHNRSSSGGNLYLDARPPGAQLRAFELMRLRTPLIPFAYAAANRALITTFEGASEVTLIDVGIGRGGQIRSLVRNPKARRFLKSLHVIGIEPDSSDQGGALEMAEEQVLQAGGQVGLDVTFTGIPKRAEDVTLADLQKAGLNGLVVANATLALHHCLGPETDVAKAREGVLAVLHAAQVQFLVMVEPDSNHFTDDFAQRFLYAYRHYRSVGRSLRSQLGAADSQLVWQEFFAPEIRNIIGHDGRERSERHEESAKWNQRLRKAGWSPEELKGLLPQAAAPDGFAVRDQGSAFSLRYQNVSLLAVMRSRR